MERNSKCSSPREGLGIEEDLIETTEVTKVTEVIVADTEIGSMDQEEKPTPEDATTVERMVISQDNAQNVIFYLNQHANHANSIMIEEASEETIVVQEVAIVKEQEATAKIVNKEAIEIASTDETAANLTVDKRRKREDALEAAAAADDGFGLWL